MKTRWVWRTKCASSLFVLGILLSFATTVSANNNQATQSHFTLNTFGDVDHSQTQQREGWLLETSQKGSSEGFLQGRLRQAPVKAPLRLAQAATDQPPIKDPKKTTKDTITGLTSVLNVTVSYNLLGLRVIATIGYRWRLFASNSRLFSNNYFSINAISRLTPAWLEGGALLVLQPASFVKLRAAYRFRGQVGAFFSGGVFDNATNAKQTLNAVKSFAEGEQILRDTIDARAKDNNGQRILPLSHIVSVDLTLQFKFKGILALVNFRYSHWWTSYTDQNTYQAFYEGGHDMIFNGGDEDFFMLDGLLGYEFKMFRFLAVTNYRRAFRADDTSFRLGPAVQWLIAPNWGPFLKPSLLVLANWYLMHPFRGRNGDAFPLIAARFGGEF